MKIDACSTREQGQSSASGNDAPCSNTVARQYAHQASTDSVSIQSSASALLASLWSPLGSLLSPSNATTGHCNTNKGAPNPVKTSEGAMQKTGNVELEQTNGSDRKLDRLENSQSISENPELQPPPEALYAPSEVPLLKALQKKRLTGTRTKQLLRAASRAYDDPPPEPELGLCCGSSCDPCVNDLWREERAVWRERWGDRRVESKDDANVNKRDLGW